MDTAVRKDDTFAFFVEFDYFEAKFFFNFSVRTVFFNEVFRSSETFNAVRESNYSTFVEHFDDSTFVDAIWSEDSFENIPWVFFELFVTEAEATVFFVDFENNNFDFRADLCEFRWVFDFFSPAKIRNVDKTVDTFFDFYEYTEVSEVAYASIVFCASSVFSIDVFPWISFKLFDTERHFAFVAVESKDNSFYVVAYFEEVVSCAEVLAPAHF